MGMANSISRSGVASRLGTRRLVFFAPIVNTWCEAAQAGLIERLTSGRGARSRPEPPHAARDRISIGVNGPSGAAGCCRWIGRGGVRLAMGTTAVDSVHRLEALASPHRLGLGFSSRAITSVRCGLDID